MFIWDETKSVRNRLKHGLAFEVVSDFDWDTPVIVDRSRHIDGETRYAAIGMLYGRLHAVIFTHRADDIRIISIRRANNREEITYAQKKQ